MKEEIKEIENSMIKAVEDHWNNMIYIYWPNLIACPVLKEYLASYYENRSYEIIA